MLTPPFPAELLRGLHGTDFHFSARPGTTGPALMKSVGWPGVGSLHRPGRAQQELAPPIPPPGRGTAHLG